MTTQMEKVTVTVQWQVKFQAPRASVRIDSLGLDEFALRCAVEGESVEEAKDNMAALKAELQKVLDL